LEIYRSHTSPAQFSQVSQSPNSNAGAQLKTPHQAQRGLISSPFNQQSASRGLAQSLSKLVSTVQELVKNVTSAKSGKPSGSGNDQFLWKPVSESDGNLAILLPSYLTRQIQDVEVRTKDGERIEEGRYSGVHNGGREHFRFSKSGGAFPPGSQVVIRLKDGSQQTVTVENTGSRFKQ